MFCEFSRSLEVSEVPSLMKHTHKTPVQKKGRSLDKNNHRPGNIPANVSYVFEKFYLKKCLVIAKVVF